MTQWGAKGDFIDQQNHLNQAPGESQQPPDPAINATSASVEDESMKDTSDVVNSEDIKLLTKFLREINYQGNEGNTNPIVQVMSSLLSQNVQGSGKTVTAQLNELFTAEKLKLVSLGDARLHKDKNVHHWMEQVVMNLKVLSAGLSQYVKDSVSSTVKITTQKEIAYILGTTRINNVGETEMAQFNLVLEAQLKAFINHQLKKPFPPPEIMSITLHQFIMKINQLYKVQVRSNGYFIKEEISKFKNKVPLVTNPAEYIYLYQDVIDKIKFYLDGLLLEEYHNDLGLLLNYFCTQRELTDLEHNIASIFDHMLNNRIQFTMDNFVKTINVHNIKWDTTQTTVNNSQSKVNESFYNANSKSDGNGQSKTASASSNTSSTTSSNSKTNNDGKKKKKNKDGQRKFNAKTGSQQQTATQQGNGGNDTRKSGSEVLQIDPKLDTKSNTHDSNYFIMYHTLQSNYTSTSNGYNLDEPTLLIHSLIQFPKVLIDTGSNFNLLSYSCIDRDDTSLELFATPEFHEIKTINGTHGFQILGKYQLTLEMTGKNGKNVKVQIPTMVTDSFNNFGIISAQFITKMLREKFETNHGMLVFGTSTIHFANVDTEENIVEMIIPNVGNYVHKIAQLNYRILGAPTSNEFQKFQPQINFTSIGSSFVRGSSVSTEIMSYSSEIRESKDEQMERLKELHQAQHVPYVKLLRDPKFGFNLLKTKDVSDLVCIDCYRANIPKNEKVKGHSSKQEKFPNEILTADYFGPNNGVYGLLITHRTSQYRWLITSGSPINSTITTRYFNKIVGQLKTRNINIKIIETDKGSQFMSQTFQHLIDTLGLQHLPSIAFEHNGSAEITIRWIKNMARNILIPLSNAIDWKQIPSRIQSFLYEHALIQAVQLHNTTINQLTLQSPAAMIKMYPQKLHTNSIPFGCDVVMHTMAKGLETSDSNFKGELASHMGTCPSNAFGLKVTTDLRKVQETTYYKSFNSFTKLHQLVQDEKLGPTRPKSPNLVQQYQTTIVEIPISNVGVESVSAEKSKPVVAHENIGTQTSTHVEPTTPIVKSNSPIESSTPLTHGPTHGPEEMKDNDQIMIPSDQEDMVMRDAEQSPIESESVNSAQQLITQVNDEFFDRTPLQIEHNQMRLEVEYPPLDSISSQHQHLSQQFEQQQETVLSTTPTMRSPIIEEPSEDDSYKSASEHPQLLLDGPPNQSEPDTTSLLNNGPPADNAATGMEVPERRTRSGRVVKPPKWLLENHFVTTGESNNTSCELPEALYFIFYSNWFAEESNLTPYEEISDKHIPKSIKQLYNHPEKEKWIAAMKRELTSLNSFGTFAAASPNEITTTPLRCFWIFSLKTLPSGEIIEKARLTVLGNHSRPGEHYDEQNIYANVVSFTAVRILLALAAKYAATVFQHDITTAFIHSTLQDEIFIQTPPGLQSPTRHLRLLKSLYGLPQSPHNWHAFFQG